MLVSFNLRHAVPLALVAVAVGYQMPLDKLGMADQYRQSFAWVLALSLITAAFMAWGIGANDVANAFASSVGAKALTMWQAVAIAAVMEFLGAVTMGAEVTDTVRSGIIDDAFFKESPETLQLGMFCSLVAAASWLCLATVIGAPVSTTHSIIGGLVGVSLAVNPASLNGEQLGLIVLSWFTSPVLSGIVSCTIFLVCRCAILRQEPAVSLRRGFILFPLLLCFTYTVFALYIILKNPQTDIKNLATNTPGLAVLIAFGIGIGLGLLTWLATIFRVRRQVAACPEDAYDAPAAAGAEVRAEPEQVELQVEAPDKAERHQKGEAKMDEEHKVQTAKVAEAAQEEDGAPQKKAHEKVLAGLNWMVNRDVHEEMDEKTREMHAATEKFPAKTEKLFTYLQVISASFDSLAHGANDVANSVGPLAAVVQIHETARSDSKSTVPIWILCFGGGFIVLGLLTYGYNVIKSIGVGLARITPSRGFSIEMGTAIIVIVGSNLGIPLSTTHCQVGSTVGIGMCEIKERKKLTAGVNWRFMIRTFGMWVLTIIYTAIIAGALMAFLNSIYNPPLQPLGCGPLARRTNVSNALVNVAGTTTSSLQSAMRARFAALDTDGDGLLSDSEIKAGLGWNMDLKGKKVTEIHGRRRRRTPTAIDVDDWLDYTCVADQGLDTFNFKICEPMCISGYRADKALECRTSPARTDASGNFLLQASFTGFSKCQNATR